MSGDARTPVYEPIFGEAAGPDAGYDPFAALQSARAGPASRQGASFEERRRDLLASARAAQAAFVDEDDGRQPEDDTDSEGRRSQASLAGDNAGSAAAAGSSPASSALKDLPPGFAFPVTTQIMQFLNKISTQPGPPLPGEGPLRALRTFQSNGSNGSGGSRASGVSHASSAAQPHSDPSRADDNDDETDDSRSRHAETSSDADSTASKPGESARTSFAGENTVPNARSAGAGEPAAKNAAASSSAPGRKSGYAAFIQSLKEPRAADTVAAIKALVLHFFKEAAAFQSRPDAAARASSPWDNVPGQDSDLAKQFQAAMRKLEAKMRASAQWSGQDENTWASTCEALEKFVLLKLHSAVFAATERERALDQELRDRIKSLTFVRPAHLDVQRFGLNNAAQWQQAGAELSKMNDFKSPRDKVVCVLNACRLLSSLLGTDGRLPGADDLLPALILVLIKVNPRNVHSNVEYIATFRNPARLKGEAGYFFTQLASAAAFVQTLDSTMLTAVTAGQFEALVGHCQQELAANGEFSYGWEGIPRETEEAVIAEAQGRPHGAEAILPQRSALENAPPRLAAGLDLAAIKAAALGSGAPGAPATLEAWKEQRLRFKDREADSLTVGEVAGLMEEYKALAAMVESLLATSSPPSDAKAALDEGAADDDDDDMI